MPQSAFNCFEMHEKNANSLAISQLNEKNKAANLIIVVKTQQSAFNCFKMHEQIANSLAKSQLNEKITAANLIIEV